MMTSSLLWLSPLLSFAVGLAMLLARDRRVLAALDVAGSLAVLGLTLAISNRVVRGGPVSALGVFRVDQVAVLFLVLIGLLAVAVSIATVGWMRQEVARGQMRAERLRYYYALVHGFIATMLVTVLADNLGILWIAMEGTTITSALLVGFHGDKHGLEAAWKYIIVTTIGISFGLFGTVLVYGAAAHAQGGVLAGAMNWSSIVAIAPRLDPGIIRIGFIFVMVGYGTKAGLAPVHMWLPDAHSQAPTPVSALLSGALIKCALFGIIRFHTIARAACGPQFSQGLLLIFGLMSVVVATPFILAQHDIKRLLGYHSVEHVGIIALGLGFGGRLGTYGALLHVINHGVTKALVFLIAGDAIGRYGTRDMRMMKGLLGIAPLAGTFLLMGAFSLAGTPPFSIFISELMVIQAGLAAGRTVTVAAFLVMVVIIFAGLIHHVGQMVFGVAPASVSRAREAPLLLLGVLLLVVVMVLLGVCMPAGLDRVLVRATEIILA
ncbi:MAG TPA: proton-conducting transporter membrane subunit [Polyangia bacterium]|jgi:Formate hydrogenlyase subunit 3/Multisubunit Na+/H+ antiporter, MnhD subunit|nr:proton-conducting transporter membrane subunit [Polyangia bacterium]